MTHRLVRAADIEARHGVFRALSEPLGVQAFRINQLELPPGHEGPEHDHTGDGQEEVYAVVSGGGTLRVDGEELSLGPGSYVFCRLRRGGSSRPGAEGLVFVGIGATRSAG